MRALTAQLKQLRALGKRLDEQEKADTSWSKTETQFHLSLPPILPPDVWESIAVPQQQAVSDPDAPDCAYGAKFFRSQQAFLDEVPTKYRHQIYIPGVVRTAQDLTWLYIVPGVSLEEALENERRKAADPDYVEPERMSREFSLAMADMDCWPLERLAPYLADWERDFASIQPAAPIDHSLAVAGRLPASADEQVFNGSSRFAESQGRAIAWTGLPLQLKLQVPDYLTHLGIDFKRLDVATLPGLISGFIQPGSSGHAIETDGGKMWAKVMPMLACKECSEAPPRIAIDSGRISVTAAPGWLVAYGKVG